MSSKHNDNLANISKNKYCKDKFLPLDYVSRMEIVQRGPSPKISEQKHANWREASIPTTHWQKLQHLKRWEQ